MKNGVRIIYLGQKGRIIRGDARTAPAESVDLPENYAASIATTSRRPKAARAASTWPIYKKRGQVLNHQVLLLVWEEQKKTGTN